MPPTLAALPTRPAKGDSPTLAVLAHLGIATPVGAAGLSLDFLPLRYVAIEAGVGTNFEGPEFEVGAHVRIPVLRETDLTLGSGFCVAHYTGHEDNGLAGFGRIFEGMAEDSFSYAVWQHARFLNLEAGGERVTDHFITRAYGGAAKLLNMSDYTCTEGYFACKPEASATVFYLGFAFGYVI